MRSMRSIQTMSGIGGTVGSPVRAHPISLAPSLCHRVDRSNGWLWGVVCGLLVVQQYASATMLQSAIGQTVVASSLALTHSLE